MKTNVFHTIALFAAVVLLAPAAVMAHAFLDHAEPRVGERVDASPSEVKAWFTQNVEPAFSKLKAFDDAGHEVDKADSHVDKNDARLMAVSIEHLPPGTYRVEWSVVSVDTHHTHGDYKFTIKP